MYNSTIKRKKCKCGCGKYPTLSYGGFNLKCAPKEILDRVGSRTELMKKNKAARNKVRSLAINDENITGGAELKRWFADRRNEMTGRCDNCGNSTCKHDDKKFHFSIAHILPKAYFKSVATHPLNWLELCFWGSNSCHTNMDNKVLDLINMNCFDKIIERFIAMYPDIAENEKRRIPAVLLEYVKNNT
jgi:hypothetical protein